LLLLNSLPLTIEHFSLSETSNLWALATQESLTPYDAAYLETAKRYNIPLATQDKALKRAAQKTGLFFAR
jgi:predicted nucleic acid-binding protein